MSTIKEQRRLSPFGTLSKKIKTATSTERCVTGWSLSATSYHLIESFECSSKFRSAKSDLLQAACNLPSISEMCRF